MADDEPKTVTVVELGAEPNADPMRWIRRIAFLASLVVGWLFILWQNKFHLSAPAVFVCLGFLAVVSTVYALWRTGVVAVAEEDPDADSTWGRPLGARGELEREKKTLLKAIKEAEFDREMGKLSKVDADEMISIYRARAIETIKELDKLEAGTAGTVREQIEREVKARIEVEAKSKKLADKAAEDAAAGKKAGQGAQGTKTATSARGAKSAKGEKGPKASAAASTPAVETTEAVTTSEDVETADAVKTPDVATTEDVHASSDDVAAEEATS